MMICSCDLKEVLPRRVELCEHYFKEYEAYYSKVNPGQTPPLTLHELIWQSEFAPFYLLFALTMASPSFYSILRQKNEIKKDVAGFYRNMVQNAFTCFAERDTL